MVPLIGSAGQALRRKPVYWKFMVGRGACSGIFKAHFLSVQDQLQLDMPANFTSDNSHKSARRDFPVFLFCLLSILAILFHKSFDPEQVLFSK